MFQDCDDINSCSSGCFDLIGFFGIKVPTVCDYAQIIATKPTIGHTK